MVMERYAENRFEKSEKKLDYGFVLNYVSEYENRSFHTPGGRVAY